MLPFVSTPDFFTIILAEFSKVLNSGRHYLKGAESQISSAKEATNFFGAYRRIQEKIIGEFNRHDYLLTSDKLSDKEKRLIQQILGHELLEIEGENAAALQAKRENYLDQTKDIFANSLQLLSRLLRKHWDEQVIILIDEYDVPLEKSYFASTSYYDEMVDFLRLFYSTALKTNEHLKFAILTGCLRVSKESIFTDFNNLVIHSILSEVGDEFFGFTEEEVEEIFTYYGKKEHLATARQWYNGYLFGNTTVYNPWSLNNFVDKICASRSSSAKPYWANTSSNVIIRSLIDISNDKTVGEIEDLMAGGSVEKPIYEDVVYAEIESRMDNLWNFLFFTGYLKAVSFREEDTRTFATLTIPNTEILSIYQNQIREWFEEQIQDTSQFQSLYHALFANDAQLLTDEITEKLSDTISYFDGTESFYHGFMAGILTNISGHRVISNREAGRGRPDLMILPTSRRKPAYVIELKISQQMDDLEQDGRKALTQIHRQNYEQEARRAGYKTVISVGISFYKKDCYVVLDNGQ